MTRYFIVDDDVIIGESSRGIAYEGKKPSGHLRYVDGGFIDVSKRIKFYIDETGQKHVMKKNDWQELECSVDDEIMFKESEWQLFEINLGDVRAEAEKKVNLQAAEYQQKFVAVELVKEYEIKETAARAYLEGKATDGQKLILDAENPDLEKQAKAIIAKAEAFNQIWPMIIKLRTQTNKTIRLAQSVEEIEAILTASEKEAAAQFGKLNNV